MNLAPGYGSIYLCEAKSEVDKIMRTQHRIWYRDSRKLDFLDEESIQLVVTSPPYPMIEMWDSTFSRLNPQIASALEAEEGRDAFEGMHQELDKVWRELYRVLQPGGFACINIGDATRKLGGRFQLFPNHSRILHSFWQQGFDTLPPIIWRKPTNAPNKFMGSGMLPAGAYVTLEHEYILIFRKGAKRAFPTEAEKLNRQESALFWEERNRWYSDLWDFKGVRQEGAELEKIEKEELSNGENHLGQRKGIRTRSGAFPFILPYRLINMYSVYGDQILDPFLGTGTTTMAAMACGRNSVGCELDEKLAAFLEKVTHPEVKESFNRYHRERLSCHGEFIQEYQQQKGSLPRHINRWFRFPVVTSQEVNLKLYPVKEITLKTEGFYEVKYGEGEQLEKRENLLHPAESCYQPPSEYSEENPSPGGDSSTFHGQLRFF